MRERIDKVSGSLSTLEKQHVSLDSRSQSILVDIRDIKEDIGFIVYRSFGHL